MITRFTLLLGLLILAACSSTKLSGRAVESCVNGTRIFRLCDEFGCKTNLSDSACCPNRRHCVLNGVCYQENQLFEARPSYYPAGIFCMRDTTKDPEREPARWYDCDASDGLYCSSYCGLLKLAAGESGVGAYAYQGKMGCCGDDEREYLKIGDDGRAACCSSAQSRVVAGACITPQEAVPQIHSPTTTIPAIPFPNQPPQPSLPLLGLKLWVESLHR